MVSVLFVVYISSLYLLVIPTSHLLLRIHSVGEVICSSTEETTIAVSAYILQVLVYYIKRCW
jgi:hypothetical protein